MSPKIAVMLGMTLGSIIGGYIPSLFGADSFSWWSLLSSTIGSLIGIFVAFRLTQNL